MSKLCTLLIAAFLLNFMLSYAARPEPTLAITQQKEVEAEKVDIEENCDGVGTEECLMRRTLAASLDYIYTQEHKP
ncbi:Phytosulfokine [Corchorus capsularis]|uniref:Phytosulfokine n=1 Tax=Corchorus capsularis TaxID=210143 RepID=A0A1R3FYN0_COCAP|nr:Phytosulfokine [Corchorus capsularis]